MTKHELRETAEQIGRLLATVVRGELGCPPSLATRLDGARVALAALGSAGSSAEDAASLLTDLIQPGQPVGSR